MGTRAHPVHAPESGIGKHGAQIRTGVTRCSGVGLGRGSSGF